LNTIISKRFCIPLPFKGDAAIPDGVLMTVQQHAQQLTKQMAAPFSDVWLD
jgi:hypothetical protein